MTSGIATRSADTASTFFRPGSSEGSVAKSSALPIWRFLAARGVCVNDFKWRNFQGAVILCPVRWYCKYVISYRNLEEMLDERGVDVDHTTIYRWVQHYARVRTGDQDVAGQTMRLEQAGAIKVFADVRSGKSIDRPGLTELLAYARAGDTLAVVRLDRLGRSLGELLTVVKELKERGVALLSLEEKIDTSSAAGELVFHVFAAIAHFERRLIAERTKDGIATARAMGKLPGRRPLDPAKASAALKPVIAGVSPTEAARQLGLGRATVYREMALAGISRPS